MMNLAVVVASAKADEGLEAVSGSFPLPLKGAELVVFG